MTKQTFYVDQNKRIIDPELFNKRAEEAAEKMALVSTTQMRRVFDELKRLKRRVERIETEEEFKKILPYILMERSKIVYTVARARDREKSKSKFYEELKNLFENYLNTDQIIRKEDYINFCDFMEAIVSFHYEKALEKKQEQSYRGGQK
ncbi:MAG: hypothetical protein AMQ22_01874 [Candidatus Methanofastidiosum methylothiophilum]|uniref:CRISPR system Cms protein Csm2 n=1 Tax=Candidatus Methanofastidiosum methylothiophilum TaxID=1705564 RepID=A0A150IU55_9EURY|nr:MAG: hypothetical protein AMQ22_01874 [Candidatus Methanofastidiosum methylthiophilus]